MTSRDQIIQQALVLSPEDRVYVADALERSLAAGGYADAEVSAAWAKEIERRIAAYDRGEMSPVAVEEAVSRIHKLLVDHRNEKAGS